MRIVRGAPLRDNGLNDTWAQPLTAHGVAGRHHDISGNAVSAHIGLRHPRGQPISASQHDFIVTQENWQAHARMTRGMAVRLERWGDIEQARILFQLAQEQERQAELGVHPAALRKYTIAACTPY
jgi:hypothetical protein